MSITFELHAPTTAMDGGEAMPITTKSMRKKTTLSSKRQLKGHCLQRQGRKQLQALMSQNLGELFDCYSFVHFFLLPCLLLFIKGNLNGTHRLHVHFSDGKYIHGNMDRFIFMILGEHKVPRISY
jgi:hypothetical protein